MKFGKSTWKSLGLGIIIIAFISFGVLYRAQVDEQTRLNRLILSTNQEISRSSVNGLKEKEAALNVQLAELDNNIKATETALIQPMDCSDIEDTLFKVAYENNLTIDAITSPGITRERKATFPYSTLLLTIRLKGPEASILNFIDSVTSRLPTSILNSAEISLNTEPSSEPELPTGIINLKIVSYEE